MQWLTLLPSIQQGDPCTSVPKHNHSAILQDLIPDTPCSTVSAAVAEKELCSCSCLGDQLFSAGCTSSWGCPSENIGKWTRSGQVSRLLPSVRLGALPSISMSTTYSDLFNINPKACRNPVAPVKALCQTQRSPVQGAGDETTPSSAVSEIHGARGPLSVPGRQAKV